MDKCFLTEVNYERVQTERDALEYDIHIDGEVIRMSFHWDHKNSKIVNENLHVFKGLLVNKKWRPKKDILTNEYLESVIKTYNYPRTPKEKMDLLMKTLHGRQEFEGQKIDLKSTEEVSLTIQCYMKNWEEVLFYLNTIRSSELMKFNGRLANGSYSLGNMFFTYKGLEYLISLEESGQFSKNCFVAMSFSKSVDEIRQQIKKTVLEAGYKPILIDEIDYDSDVTINDAIITQIKKCKFLISDFTEQKHGVYFEAGYALGLKRPVIYTCKSEDFKNSHFDTNHYPHIVYSTVEELGVALKNKIGAIID